MLLLNDFSTSVKKALKEIDRGWESYKGTIVCGTHDPNHVEEYIDAIRDARENKLPFLGICFGYQLAAIEYARNVLNVKDATSEEFFWEDGPIVVAKRPQLKVGLHDNETWWSNYDVVDQFKTVWHIPDNFFVTPFHPEYSSRKKKPHPILKKFLNYAKDAV